MACSVSFAHSRTSFFSPFSSCLIAARMDSTELCRLSKQRCMEGRRGARGSAGAGGGGSEKESKRDCIEIGVGEGALVSASRRAPKRSEGT